MYWIIDERGGNMDRNTFLERLTGALGRVGEAMTGLSAKLAGKVDAVEGMGLSANDFNSGYKSKLDKLLGYGGLSPGDIDNEAQFTRIELE